MSLKKNIFLFFGILFLLASTRLIPHPPNFTVLLALSFYVPAIFGIRYIFFVLLSFAVTDILIGYHYLTHWTWGSVILIGLLSRLFCISVSARLIGVFFSVLVYFILTNFAVWLQGNLYNLSLEGLFTCYVMAIPFLGNSLISSFMFSILIEILLSKNLISKSALN